MAYYTSNFYQNDAGECNLTPYGYGYDVVPDQDSTHYSWYEFSEPKSIDYHPSAYYDAYDPFVTQSHSTYRFNEPRFLQYEPAPHDSGYFSSQTHYIISYSTAEFNEPEFEEYDPTPYDGGYDIVQTYGKPLPPSDETCYPRSTPMSNGPPLNGTSFASIPSPYGKDDGDDHKAKPQKESKESDAGKEEQKGNDKIADGSNNQHDGGEKRDLEKLLDLNQGEDTERYTNGGGHGLPDYDYGNGSGRIGGYGHEYDKQTTQYPYGYGLEAMDLCESIFGYWPCLARKNKNNNWHGGVRDEGSNNHNPWQGAADYIFGSPYGQLNDGNRGHQSYYCQQQPYYIQDEYDENSWKHSFNIF